MPFYDFLVAHSKQADPSPLRFFVFGHYEMLTENVAGDHESYKPPSLDASGEVLKRTIEALQDKFGKFDLITGHSLGCIALASLLKRSGPELLPATLHFDRGPSSIDEASRNYPLSGLLNLIAHKSGLSIHIDQEIKSFFKRCHKSEPASLQNSCCLITGVEEDTVFPGRSNLVSSNRLDKLHKKIKFAKWVFNPPGQMSHTRAHHSWRLMNFNKSYLTASSGNVEMLPSENLAHNILRLVQTKKILS